MGKLIHTLIATLFVAQMLSAQETDKTQAVAMVTSAAEMIKAKGETESIKAMNDSAGPFVKGELYIFAYDTTGTMVAHPKNPKLIGKNLINVPDVDGKLFRKDIIQIAMSKGNGWVDYKYKNPVNGKLEQKTTYVVLTGAIVLCCGIYK